MNADCDTVKFWLDAAGRYPVLKPDQVLLLAQKVQSNPPGSKARQKAVEKLVRHNLKLIPKIARRALKNKTGKSFGGNYTEDIFQCGVLGLTRAAELYDPKRGYAFSTYAHAWIFQAIQRDLYNNMSVIRIPENTIREYYSIFRNSTTNKDLKNIDPKKMLRYVDAGFAMNCRSLEAKIYHGSDNEFLMDRCSSSAGLEEPSPNVPKDTIFDLVALSSTCEASKEMVIEHFDGDLPMGEIAVRFGVSRNKVAEMIKGCLASIKENMALV